MEKVLRHGSVQNKYRRGSHGDLLFHLSASGASVESIVRQLYLQVQHSVHLEIVLPLGWSQHDGVTRFGPFLSLMGNLGWVSFHQPAVTFSQLCNGLRCVLLNSPFFFVFPHSCQIYIVVEGLSQPAPWVSLCSFTSMFPNKSLAPQISFWHLFIWRLELK